MRNSDDNEPLNLNNRRTPSPAEIKLSLDPATATVTISLGPGKEAVVDVATSLIIANRLLSYSIDMLVNGPQKPPGPPGVFTP